MDTKDDRFFLTELESGQFRRANPDDIAEALKKEKRRNELTQIINDAQAELQSIYNQCGQGRLGHKVCYDTSGWPYDVRHCVACGWTSLL